MPNEFRVVEDASEMEESEYMVCIKATVKTPFADNVFDLCCKCGEKVQMRPGGPTIPKPICLECAMPDMLEAEKKNELEVMASKEAMEALARLRHGH